MKTIRLLSRCAVALAFSGLASAAMAVDEVDLTVIPGMVLDLDASHPETITTNDNGRVTRWQSRVGTVSYRNDDSDANAYGRPVYDGTANDGLGAVVYGINPVTGAITNQWLMSDGMTTNRTVFLVLQTYLPSGRTAAMFSEFYGKNGGHEIACNGDGSDLWVRGAAYEKYGATNWIDGVNIGYSSINWTPKFDANHIINIRAGDETVTNAWNYAGYVDSKGIIYSPNAHSMVLGYPNKNQIPIMRVAELVTFNRDLTDAERQFVTDALYTKWVKGQSYTGCKTMKFWTGGAGTSVWDDAANWNGGTVPTSDCGVYMGDEAITVTGTATGKSFYPIGAGSLSFASGAALSVPAESTLELPSGTTFGDVFKKQGSGTFCLKDRTADYSEVALQLEAGSLDLAGGDCTFKSVSGIEGVVINSAAAKASLTLATDDASAFDVTVATNILVKKSGAGALTFSAAIQTNTDLTLSGGDTTLGAEELVVPAPFHVHLDASAMSTLSTNAAGEVVDWCNLGRDKQVFTSASNIWNHLPPYYDKTAFGGRGGVRFGHVRPCTAYPDGLVTQTVLSAWFPINISGKIYAMNTNITMFIVLARDPNEKSGYHCDKNPFVISRTTNNSGQYGVQLYPVKHNTYGLYVKNTNGLQPRDFWINGNCMLDADRGYTNSAVYVLNNNNTLLKLTACPDLGETMLLAVRNDPAVGSALVGNNSTYQRMTIGRSGGSENGVETGLFRGWIGEIIFCQDFLSDGEFHQIQRALIKKWGIDKKVGTPPGAGPLPETSTLGLADGATLNLSGLTQSVAKVTLEGAKDCTVTNGSITAPAAFEITTEADRTFGALKVPDGWDLSATEFSMVLPEGAHKARPGVVLKTEADMAGEFSSVTGVGTTLKYHSRKVTIASGLVILFR